MVLAREEKRDHRDARGLVPDAQPPALVRPEELLVRPPADLAVDSALTAAWTVDLGRRLELPRPHLAVEREGVPLGERRHAQVVLRTLVQLFGCFGHGLRC
jgi:hypothetical protein